MRIKLAPFLVSQGLLTEANVSPAASKSVRPPPVVLMTPVSYAMQVHYSGAGLGLVLAAIGKRRGCAAGCPRQQERQVRGQADLPGTCVKPRLARPHQLFPALVSSLAQMSQCCAGSGQRSAKHLQGPERPVRPRHGHRHLHPAGHCLYLGRHGLCQLQAGRLWVSLRIRTGL